MEKYLSSHAALKELGNRLKAYRIYSSYTQTELAEQAGLSRKSIQNMEMGEDVNFSSIIKVLSVLGLDSNLELLVPDSSKRPSYYLKNNVTLKRRSRANSNKIKNLNNDFKWGDESK